MAEFKGKKQEAFVAGSEFTLMNVEVEWANIQADNPDTRFEHAWKIDAILSDSEAKSMEASGFGIRKNKDGRNVLTLKTKCVSSRTQKRNSPPEVFGRDGRTPFTEELGNGSVCNIKGYAKYVEVNGKTYLPAYINKVQVVEHVSRGSQFEDLDAEVEA